MKQEEISLVAYSKIREACAEALTKEENELLTHCLVKGRRTVSAKYKLMLRMLTTKAYGGNVDMALRNA